MQTVALAKAFLARFFDNEITAGSGDLRSSFFWLVAFLAPIGILIPVSGLILFHGSPELLRVVSLPDKVLYLGISIVAIGGLAVLTWSGLLVDRRDALVLGTLPVSLTVIVRAKLLAITAYVGLVALGMHAGASLAFGLILGYTNPLTFVALGIVAHFLASSFASAFILFTVSAVQSVLLATVGPKLFARLSPVLQTIVTAFVVGTLLTLPSVSRTIVDAVNATDGRHSWVFALPAVWFLGIYEWMLGTKYPLMDQMAARAVIALAVVIGTTALSYPLACRRQFRMAIEGAPKAGGRRMVGRIAEWVPRATTRRAASRASIQLVLATFGRITTHRLVLALSLGAVAAFVIPACVGLVRSASLPALPPVAVLAAPLVAMAFSLIGIRIAASLPAEIKATWMASLAGPPDWQLRMGLRRTMHVLGVLPWMVCFVPIAWWLWGASIALTSAAIGVGMSAVLTEVLLWGFTGMPCSQPWRPERVNLRKWWPLFLGAFLLISQGLPRITLLVCGSPVAGSIVVAVFLVSALVVRVTGRRERAEETYETEVPEIQVLNLS
jgi:hypothetical protein